MSAQTIPQVKALIAELEVSQAKSREDLRLLNKSIGRLTAERAEKDRTYNVDGDRLATARKELAELEARRGQVLPFPTTGPVQS